MPRDQAQIAVVNAGSSSLKFAIFSGESAICNGLIDRLGQSRSEEARAVVRGADRVKLFEGPLAAADHGQALEWLWDWLGKSQLAFRPSAVGHRIVHGGDTFVTPARVTPEIFSRLEALVPLAPLHQPHNLGPIRSLAERFPQLPQVVCFDTAFHATQSHIERMYGLPRSYFEKGIKRYGFHGLSYEFISSRLMDIDEKAAAGRTVVCHLGNGASLCALNGGRSVATTMGFTALDGLPMGTRSGSIDPGVLLHFLEHDKMSATQLTQLLYDQSGLLGISGISADMRDLLSSREKTAAEAVEYFCYRIAREIGSLAAALGGLDAIVFTGGIGEHAVPVRARVCELAGWLGVRISAEANEASRSELHSPESSVHVLVIPTNEELMIARHTRRLLENPAASHSSTP